MQSCDFSDVYPYVVSLMRNLYRNALVNNRIFVVLLHLAMGGGRT